jgi:acetylglutamate kinase
MIVVKLGGAALKGSLGDPALFRIFAGLREPFVIVHGGGPKISEISQALGLEAEFVDGQRVTTPEVLEVVEMVLRGHVNPAIVRGLLRAGRSAAGLSGVDAELLRCDFENPALGLVGRVEKVNPKIIRDLLALDLAPVVAPVGLLHNGQACNVNADLAAAALAVALKADRLLFLTDRDGILDAEGELVRSLSGAHLRELAQSDVISGGMKVKARAMLEVLEALPQCRIEVMNGLSAEALRQSFENGASVGTAIR